MKYNLNPNRTFNPVTIELTFESQEEVNWFYWVSNSSISNIWRVNEVTVNERDYDKPQMHLYNAAKELLELTSK